MVRAVRALCFLSPQENGRPVINPPALYVARDRDIRDTFTSWLGRRDSARPRFVPVDRGGK